MLENETLDLAITFPAIQQGDKIITRVVEGEELATGLSWRSNSDIPYKYRELISQIEEKYRLINESGENFYV